MHGPDEIAFVDEIFSMLEEVFKLKKYYKNWNNG